ncbi:hypothetical protein NU688_18780 [Variovorax sp. ZS18.2.2]|uniref:hypothetical protein n=1 Tax=Variovorax sp. ZS18.2.2 TaxID=2971255 RepID=UPI002150BAD7|nr:hypothetical protein [Variovorax sp. ZS18.2.2]MCR6478214.1 hypothetical protein [Variovorax sp. ZS18.2.2]
MRSRFRFLTGARLIALVGGVMTAAVLWLLFAEPGAEQAPVVAAPSTATTVGTKPVPAGDSVVLARRAPEYKVFAPGASPYLMSAGPLERKLDVDQLRRDLARAGKPVEDEVARQVGLARYRDRMNTLGELLPSLSEEERRQEAYEVLKRLPEHVAQGGLRPNEAVVVAKLLSEVGQIAPEIRDEFTRQLAATQPGYAGQVPQGGR